MITYKIHLIRHGMTEGNVKGLYLGRTDLPLCEEGRERLALLRDTCGYPAAQKLYCGPLLRCRQTAEMLYPDTLTELMDDLTECDFGAFDGRAIGELKDDPAFTAWVDAGMKTPPPAGESNEEFEQRACTALDHIFDDMMARKITSAAVVTHGGLMMTLLAKFGYPRREKAYDWMVPNGVGYTIVMTPQMWMRDEGFEVFELLPYRYEAFQRLGPERFRQYLLEWNENNGSFPEEEPDWEDDGYDGEI